MRIPEGDVGRCIYFVAVDETDLKTRKTGLSSFTAVYSVDGEADVTMTTPTVTEIDSSTMPGVYALDIDESGMVDVPAGVVECEVAIHITKTGMWPVTVAYSLFRQHPKGAVSDTGAAAGDFDTDLPQKTGTDHYKGSYVKFLSGNLEEQQRLVTGSSWTGSKTNLAFSTAFTTAPADGDKFILINQ